MYGVWVYAWRVGLNYILNQTGILLVFDRNKKQAKNKQKTPKIKQTTIHSFHIGKCDTVIKYTTHVRS